MRSARASASGAVVGDVDHRDVEVPLDPADLQPHVLAQPGVQVRQRLVQQQHSRLGDQCPGQRDPLLLTAGKLVRIARPEAA